MATRASRVTAGSAPGGATGVVAAHAAMTAAPLPSDAAFSKDMSQA